MQAVTEEPDLEPVLWSAADPVVDQSPSGTAAAIAVVAFFGFGSGLGIAALFLL